MERRVDVIEATSMTMSLTRRNAGDAASPKSLAVSLAAEVRLGGIRGKADTSETGVAEIGMSRHGAVATTAIVESVVPRDVAVATGTMDEGGSGGVLYDRRFSNSERNSLSHFEQEMSTREQVTLHHPVRSHSLTLARQPSIHRLHCK